MPQRKCLIFHRWSPPAPLGDKTNRMFKLCEVCGASKVVNER